METLREAPKRNKFSSPTLDLVLEEAQKNQEKSLPHFRLWRKRGKATGKAAPPPKKKTVASNYERRGRGTKGSFGIEEKGEKGKPETEKKEERKGATKTRL